MSSSPTRDSTEVSLADRVLDGAFRCLARAGLAGTTLGDVAAEASCSRASIYRAFPGGKNQVFSDLSDREIDRFIAETAARVAGTDELAEALTVGISSTARAMADDPALSYLLAHEPEAVLPVLGFGEVDHLYAAAAKAGRHALARFLEPEQAAWAGEWVARVIISYEFIPGSEAAGPTDLADPGVARTLVDRFLIPALAPAGVDARQLEGSPT